MSVLYVTPGPDGMDYEYTWDDIAWESFERIWREERERIRFAQYIIYVILTKCKKGVSYVRSKTSPR